MEITNHLKVTYDIEFCNGNIAKPFSDTKDYYVCIDKRVLKFHKQYLDEILNNAKDIYVIESLESNKNMETVNEILAMLFNTGASKNSTLVSIGGGICGDVAGFAASIFKRGMNFINVPTTLLSQVDSSVGGKVGVNFENQKNAIGDIYFPGKVIVDQRFLKTLTTRQFKEGLVEIIKHGLVIDKTIIEMLDHYDNIKQLINDDITNIIETSIKAKAKIVEQDILDSGVRHVLNFGHSFAHAIELNNDLYHGECVCLGILVATYNAKLFDEVKTLFEKFECIRRIENLDLSLMSNDKKSDGAIIKEVFLNDINEFKIVECKLNNLISDYEERYHKLKSEVNYSPTNYVFSPVSLSGNVVIPPSKSILHRYLIASALSKTEIVLTGVNCICDDVAVTIEALKQLGSDVTYSNDTLIIKKKDFDLDVINMKESGTSLRVLLPLLMHFNDEVTIVGENNLGKRPMSEYFKIFEEQGVYYSHGEDYLPLTVKGKLKPGVFNLDGSVSSQFVSGLLFLLPILDGDSTINIKNNLESLPYVLLTIKVLNDFGVTVECNEDYTVFKIKGNQKYLGKMFYQIEQDYSSRAFFEVAGSFDVHQIKIENELDKSLQGDTIVCEIVSDKIGSVDLTNVPDTALILAVYYAINGGVLKNVGRLKYKESNRLDAIKDFLTKMNIRFEVEDDDLVIHPGKISGGVFDTYLDHRVTMALIIASTVATDKIYLPEIKSINKSFPTFIECYETLGGFVDEE